MSKIQRSVHIQAFKSFKWIMLLSVFTIFNFNLAAQERFILTWDSQVGCLEYDDVDKRIPLEDIQEGNCIKVCEGSTVRYNIYYDEEEENIEQINWSVQGGDIAASNQNTLQVEWPVAGEDAEVNIEIIMADGEVIYATICIEIKPKPNALFEVEGLENEFYCQDTDLYFNNLSSTIDGSNIVSSIWDFGNDDSSNEENPVYSYNQTGTYTVTLTVRDECNCVDTFTQIINISDPSLQIECPTVSCENSIETYYIEVNPESGLEEVPCKEDNWSAEGGEIIEIEDNWVSVLWNEVDETGFGTIYFDQSNCDTGCTSVLAARIPVVLQNGTIQGGDTSLCGDDQSVFSLPQWPTTDFTWTLEDIDGNIYTDNVIVTDQRNEIAVGAENLLPGTYTLKSNYFNTLLSCSGNAEIDIEILENLEINEHPEISCIENEVDFLLTNTNATNAQWTITRLGNIVATGTGNSFGYAFAQTGLHKITVNAEGFCNTFSYIEIVENPNFPYNTQIIGDNNICPNQLLTYSLSNVIDEGTIIWTVNNGQIIGPNVGDEVSVIFDEDEGFTNYEVSAQLMDSNAEDCSSSIITRDIDLFEVNENIVNTDTNPPSTGPESFCASSLAEFSLNYQDSDTYVWTFDPPQLATVSSGIGTHSPTILFNEPFTDTGGNYIDQGEIIVNAKVCGQMQEIDRFDFTLIESPTLTVNMPAEVCAGTSFDLDITSSIDLTVSDPEDINISFDNNSNNFNNVTINSPTSFTINNIILGNVDNNIAIGYNISIENETCNNATTSGTITVKPTPIADISLQSGSNVFCLPQDIDSVLEVNIQNPNGSESYQWQYNGQDITGETSNTLDIDSLNNSIYNFGSYRVKVTGGNGCSITTSVYEIFEECEEEPECGDETLSITSSWISCDQVEVTATYSGNPNLVTLNTSDSFSNANATLDSTQSSQGQITKVFNVNTSGSYKFRAKAVYDDCYTEVFTSVTVGYHPILNTEITCNGNGYDVILYNDSTFLPSFNNINVIYQITNTDTQNTVNTSSANFNEATANLPAGNYEFSLSIEQPPYPECMVTESFDLTLPDPTFQLEDVFGQLLSSPFCTEEQVLLSPTNPDPDISYVWSFQNSTNTSQDIIIQMDGPNDDQEIILTATNPYGCSSSYSISNLEVLKAEFNGSISPTNSLICDGSSIILDYDVPIGGNIPNEYQWILDGQDIQGATNSTYSASTDGLYSLHLTDTNGCLYEELAGVYVNVAPNPTFNMDVDPEVCEGEDLVFSGTVSPQNAEYQISVLQNGQATILQAWTTGPDINYTETMDTPGVFDYLIEVEDVNTGCLSSEIISITVLPNNEPTVSASLQQCEPYEVRLDITNPQQNATYTWSNGMQGTSILVNTGGAYSVTYQPQSGCSSSTSFFVPKASDEFLWVFPDGCIDFCVETVRSEPIPYIIGPIPEFNTYLWDFNNSGSTQSGVVSDYNVDITSGVLNLSLTNDFNCTFTSDDLNIEIDGECEEACNIEYELSSSINSNTNYLSYNIFGAIANNNNFPITITLTSINGVYIPSVITIPANSSVTFGPSNPLVFIPDANFTGGIDYVQVIGQQGGDTYCVDEIEIEYETTQSNIRAKLKASPNPVSDKTELFYEFLNMDKIHNAHLEIYNTLGYFKDRKFVTDIKGQVSMNLSTYSSGQYIVVLKHNGKIVEQLILIKE